jgi:hypothetical protein
MSNHDRTTALDELGACLSLSSLADLRSTLGEIDVLLTSVAGEPASEVILLAFAELLATEIQLHDTALDRELQHILDTGHID